MVSTTIAQQTLAQLILAVNEVTTLEDFRARITPLLKRNSKKYLELRRRAVVGANSRFGIITISGLPGKRYITRIR